MYTALSGTTTTLTALLEPRLRFLSAAFGGTWEVTPHTPRNMSEKNQQGLSVWLYRIERDEHHLNQPARRIAIDRVDAKPMPLRLHYLITPIVQEDDEGLLEQKILGTVLQTFHDKPILEGTSLNPELRKTNTRITVRLESQGLEEITRVWDALERSYQLCVSYEVSVVMVASYAEAEDVAPVDAALPEYGMVTDSEASR